MVARGTAASAVWAPHLFLLELVRQRLQLRLQLVVARPAGRVAAAVALLFEQLLVVAHQLRVPLLLRLAAATGRGWR
eukprot:577334-Prymnesium_polylepis.1